MLVRYRSNRPCKSSHLHPSSTSYQSLDALGHRNLSLTSPATFAFSNRLTPEKLHARCLHTACTLHIPGLCLRSSKLCPMPQTIPFSGVLSHCTIARRCCPRPWSTRCCYVEQVEATPALTFESCKKDVVPRESDCSAPGLFGQSRTQPLHYITVSSRNTKHYTKICRFP